MQSGFLSWLRCAPPPTHMRRSGQRVKAPPLPPPVYLHYDEEKHWYSERRLPNPYVPVYQPHDEEDEEEGKEDGGIPQGNMGDTDAPVFPVVNPANPVVDPVPPVANPMDNAEMRTALAQIAANTASMIASQAATSAALVNAVNTLSSNVSSSNAVLATAVYTGLASVNSTLNQFLISVNPKALPSLAASQSLPTVNVSTSTGSPPIIAYDDTDDDMHVINTQTSQTTSTVVTTTAPTTLTSVSAMDPTMTIITTTGPVSTTTVTTTGPTSTTTTTTRRKSAVNVPTNLSTTSLGAGINQTSDPGNYPQLLSVENAEQLEPPAPTGGSASGKPSESSIKGETQGLTQLSKEEEKKKSVTESNTQNQHCHKDLSFP